MWIYRILCLYYFHCVSLVVESPSKENWWNIKMRSKTHTESRMKPRVLRASFIWFVYSADTCNKGTWNKHQFSTHFCNADVWRNENRFLWIRRHTNQIDTVTMTVTWTRDVDKVKRRTIFNILLEHKAIFDDSIQFTAYHLLSLFFQSSRSINFSFNLFLVARVAFVRFSCRY